MGFCLYNNVAVAARHAVRNLGVKRCMILDWDVHHGSPHPWGSLCRHLDVHATVGNGTQRMLETDSDILYVSLHR